MDEDTRTIIQACLLDGLTCYLRLCYRNNEKPKQEVRDYFNKKIKELESK